MAQTPLVFDRARVATPGPVPLVFGDDGAAPTIYDVTLHAAGRVSGLRLHINATAGATTLHGAGRITGARLRINAGFDINVSRPAVGGARSHWQDADPLQHVARSAWQQSAPMPVGTHAHWQDAAPLHRPTAAAWQTADRLQRGAGVHYQEALALRSAPLAARFESALHLQCFADSHFQEALRLQGAPLRGRFQETLRDRQARASTHFQVAIPVAAPVTAGMRVAAHLQRAWGGRYQEAWPPRPGQWQRPGPPAPEPCYYPSGHLVFDAAFDGTLPAHLVFVCERHGPPGPQPHPGLVIVPVRKFYVTLNSIALIRVSDGMPLPADSFSLSIDTDSWTWQWSASMQPHLRQYLAPVAGEPVQVQATINGVPYRLCAESITRERSFGSARIAVRGRGLGAVLDAPYAPTLNFDNTAGDLSAQQLIAAALTVNGVGMGWDVDWQLQDWQVPAGAWSHQGTWLSAVTTIAAAAGGYVQPHATLPTLRILPRYPAAPWDWAASVLPDFALPADVVSVEGIEWTTRPAYDRVHVSGQAQGVLAEVTRSGTAGALVAPMVTDPLITHADAARQRGLAVLADTGAQARVSLTLPVLQETGLILPGKFVRYSDGAVQRTGIVRGCSLGWSRPTLRQTLQIETHGSD